MALKKKKYPKKPKASATLKSWENYAAKCKEVDKYNSQLEADKKKKETIIKKFK